MLDNKHCIVVVGGRDVAVPVEGRGDVRAALAAMDLPFVRPEHLRDGLLSVFHEATWVVVADLAAAVALSGSETPRLKLEVESNAAGSDSDAIAVVRDCRWMGLSDDHTLFSTRLATALSATAVALFLEHTSGGALPWVSLHAYLGAACAGAFLLVAANALLHWLELRAHRMHRRLLLPADWLPVLTWGLLLCVVVAAVGTVVSAASDFWPTSEQEGHKDATTIVVALVLLGLATVISAATTYRLYAAGEAAPEETVQEPPSCAGGPVPRRFLAVALWFIAAGLLTGDDGLNADTSAGAFAAALTAGALELAVMAAVAARFGGPRFWFCVQLAEAVGGVLLTSVFVGVIVWISTSIEYCKSHVSRFLHIDDDSFCDANDLVSGGVLGLVAALLATAESFYFALAQRPVQAALDLNQLEAGGYQALGDDGALPPQPQQRRALYRLLPGVAALALVAGGVASVLRQSDGLDYRSTWNGAGHTWRDTMLVVAPTGLALALAATLPVPSAQLGTAAKGTVSFLALLSIAMAVAQIAHPAQWNAVDDDDVAHLRSLHTNLYVGSALIICGALAGSGSTFVDHRSAKLPLGAAGGRSGLQLLLSVAVAGLAVAGCISVSWCESVTLSPNYGWGWSFSTDFCSPDVAPVLAAFVVGALTAAVALFVTPLMAWRRMEPSTPVLALRLGCAVALVALAWGALLGQHSVLHFINAQRGNFAVYFRAGPEFKSHTEVVLRGIKMLLAAGVLEFLAAVELARH